MPFTIGGPPVVVMCFRHTTFHETASDAFAIAFVNNPVSGAKLDRLKRYLVDLLLRAAFDKARGRGGNFHTASCQLRQLLDAQRRSTIVLCPALKPDAVTKDAIMEGLLPGSPHDDDDDPTFKRVAGPVNYLATHSACVLTVTIAVPSPTNQVIVIMWTPEDFDTTMVDNLGEFPYTPAVPRSLADPTACLTCAAPAPEKTCARCRLARYCGTACQRAHWPEHKKACASSGAGGIAVAVNEPEMLLMGGGTPHTEADLESSLWTFNMQGDAGSVVFLDIRDPRSNELNLDLDTLESRGVTTFVLAHWPGRLQQLLQ